VKTYRTPPYPSTHKPGHLSDERKAERGRGNKYGQTHDIKNLFISDGKPVHHRGAEKSTLTIVTLAIRQAEYISGQMKQTRHMTSIRCCSEVCDV